MFPNQYRIPFSQVTANPMVVCIGFGSAQGLQPHPYLQQTPTYVAHPHMARNYGPPGMQWNYMQPMVVPVITRPPPSQVHLAHTVTRDNVNMGHQAQIRYTNQDYPCRIPSRRSLMVDILILGASGWDQQGTRLRLATYMCRV